jgi:hypothetical protein
MIDSAARENSGQRSRWLRFVVAGCLLITLIGLLLTLRNAVPTARPASAGVQRQFPATGARAPRAPSVGRVGLSHRRSTAAQTGTAQEIVAGKLGQFARSRREIVHRLAGRASIHVPDEVERFFDAVEAGGWDEIKAAFDAFHRFDDDSDAPGRRPGMEQLWPAILETFGTTDTAHRWPAQKLLDYGEAVLGSLRPGMVYVGGTDPGRFIPTLLNETSESERHIILTQNALADNSYLDYINFLYADRFATIGSEESQRAFEDFMADAQKRLLHDQQFPEEPKQIRPGEDVKLIDGRLQVSGQVAVMAINEKLLQTLLLKNPDITFALEESFPMKSTYAEAALLGPIMELRAPDGQNALTAERATQSLDYWRATTQQMLSDPEASGSPETLKTWSKMAVGQANLFAERNYTAEAEQTYRLASEIWPGCPEAAFSLSQLLARTGRADEAVRLIDEFGLKNPDRRPEVEVFRKTLSSVSSEPQAPRP